MTEHSFDTSDLTRAASDTFTVRRVFGEAYQHAGCLVVPVARVTGITGSGAGAGSGDARDGDGDEQQDAPAGTAVRDAAAGGGRRGESHGAGDGGGGGFAAHVRPLGVVVVDGKGARWQPTVDVDRAILGGQVAVAVVATVWALAWAVRRR